MNLAKRFSPPDYIAAVIIIIYFVAGIFLTADYGVNWDDDFQRTNGLNNWEFITGHDKKPLLESGDKYHGPAFEIVLIAVEKAFRLTDNHDIFLARHRFLFVLFVIGVAVFFLLCRRLFANPWLGLAGMLMLLLTPRIFGEGFYNPKDISFLVAMTLAMYSLLAFVLRPSLLNAFFHAFTCAFALDIRLIGILFIPVTVALVCLSIYQRRIEGRWIWLKLILFVGAWFGLSILMWPILTQGTLMQLLTAYHQLSNYTLWDGLNRYLGDCIRASKLPWHYHWVWMLISLPELNILLFIAGTLILLFSTFRKGFIHSTKNVFLLLSLFLFLFPLIFRSIKGSIVLDGWRHVYFVYPFMVLLSIYGLEQLYRAGSKSVSRGILFLLLLSFADDAIQIVTMHPFEYVYFNHTANWLFRPIDQKFEMDYWGVSFKQGLEYLIAHRTGDQKIKVAFQDYPGSANYKFLPASQRDAIEETDRDHAQYYLAYYRDFVICPDSYTISGQLIHTIRAQGNKVLGIYRLR